MEKEIRNALEVLRKGGTILYPTDTLWGIGCDATNEKAVEKVITIKERTAITSLKGEESNADTPIAPFRAGGKSFIALVSSDGMLNRFIKDVPEQAWDLIKASEKPITIIYDAGRGLAKNILADNGSVGVRLVQDEFCQRLIHTFGKPVVSTSANISGRNAPKNFSEISSVIISQVDYVVNWRQDDFTKAEPSSIIKLKANGEFTILRK